MENVLGTDPFNHIPLKEQLGKNIYDCEHHLEEVFLLFGTDAHGH